MIDFFSRSMQQNLVVKLWFQSREESKKQALAAKREKRKEKRKKKKEEQKRKMAEEEAKVKEIYSELQDLKEDSSEGEEH